MGITDTIRKGLLNFLRIDLDYQDKPRIDTIQRNRNYRRGVQKRPLKVKGYDDNIIVNISGLIVDRWVSWLVGHGVDFDLPGDEKSAEQEYIDRVWDANRKQVLMHKVAVNGAEAGNSYVKIIPDGMEPGIPRLVAIDPMFVKLETDGDDYEKVTKFIISYGDEDDNKRTVEISSLTETGAWEVVKVTKIKNRQELVEPQPWGYDFPPIAWCQNLPSVTSCYGEPDIDDNTRAMQDGVNFIASNINKIIRLHSHPQAWGKNLGNVKELTWGVDKMLDAGPNGEFHNLEMQSDLSSSTSFLQWYIKELYATTRTVDLDSLADKLGALTNFGLRVLFEDTMTKLATKRALYGEMFSEINRRLLVIAGFSNTDPGEIFWHDVIPENATDTITELQALKNLGVVSNETIAMRAGLDYEAEQEKIANDKASESNVGAALLTAFNRNQVTIP